MVDKENISATPELPEKKPRGHNLKGRPKGCKNKQTLVKEAIRGGFDDMLVERGSKLLEMLFDEAINNKNMQAAKMLVDRALPTSKAIDLEQLEKSKGLTISINVGSLEKELEPIDAEVIIDEDT